MAPRLELQDLLVEILESPNVYFQPPPSIQMEYPCIVYTLDSDHVNHADNEIYIHLWAYQVTVIDQNPDSDIPQRVLRLPLCRFDRTFQADNLNHTTFNIFF